jgi:uncharacterized protein
MLKPHRSTRRRRLPVIGAVAFTCWFCMDRSGAESVSPLEQLMALTGVVDHAPASMEALTADLRAKNPDVPAALWDNYAARINDHSALVRLYAPIYRRHVSEADARALVKFFESPLGLRYSAALSQIGNDTDAAAKTWAVSVANDLLREKGVPHAAEDAPSNAIPQDPETEQTRAVRELMRVSGARARAQLISAQIISRLRNSTLDDALMRRARRRLGSGDALSESWLPAYARHLTPEDTRAMIAFFRTPVGRRWVQALPRIQDECVIASSTFAKEASRGAIREVLGPLPQWRLMHPAQSPPAAVPGGRP